MKFNRLQVDPNIQQADEIIEAMFMDADLNGDGVVSLDEWNLLHKDGLSIMQLNSEEGEEEGASEETAAGEAETEDEPTHGDPELQEEGLEEGEDPYEETAELDVVFFMFFCLLTG